MTTARTISAAAPGATSPALATFGIVREITGRQRNRLHACDEYLSILTREPAV